MRLPIGYALAYPARIATAFGRIDWSTLGRLDFEAPDLAHVPLPARWPTTAGRTGGTAPAWLSAANEVAVEAFLAGRMRWPQIADVVRRGPRAARRRRADTTVDDIIAADATARRVAHDIMERELVS